MTDQSWILDRLPMGIWVARAPDGVVVQANAGFENILGMPALSSSGIEDAPLTYSIFDRSGALYPVERLPFSRVLATGAPAVVDDIVIHRADGKRANVRAFGHPVHGERGEITHVVVAFVDITKEVEAELARDSLDSRLALVVKHAPIVIWTTDERGVLTLCEGAGLRAMGVESADLVGKNAFEVYRDHPTLPDHLRRALTGESYWYSVEVKEAIYETYITPLRDAGGKVSGVAAVSNELTELRNLQRATIQNDRVLALGTMAASVAHEINNPLAYMLIHLELWQRDVQKLEQALAALPAGVGDDARSRGRALRVHYDPIASAVQRIAQVTRQLGTFSHVHGERLQPIEWSTVIRAVLDLIGKELEARTQFRLELSSSLFVQGDEARLVQVVLNLLLNAMQAPRALGQVAEVVLRTRDLDQRVLLEVDDNGVGIPSEDRQRVFEPFFTTKSVGEGSGLGLFVCRNIVRSLGGEIAVGDSPGGGARFSVTLPATSRSGAVEADVVAPTLQRLGRILVVDDDPRLARSLAQALSGAGHEVTVAHSAQNALQFLHDGSFELIYCDLMMPGATGMELLAALRAQGSRAAERLVMMTGGAFTPEARAFVAANQAPLVQKPFNVVDDAAARLGSFAPREPERGGAQ